MKSKIREWIRRYLLADILSTILSLGTAWVIHRATGDNVLAAFLGSAMASISFYGIIAYGDVRKSLEHHRKHALRYNFASYFKDLRNLIIEFGPSEILDVLAVRPFFMYLMPKLMGEFVLGTFVGKMIADLVFFIPAIIMYEVRKKHLSD
ncbi:MAG TPA: hypothetical protein VKA69_11530 [Desulfobacteria bacterium]|nr:hypothetical protein [Desulfobacteria bacterium]